MLLIEEKQVREILTPEKCVAAMRQAFMDLENGKCDMPQRLICKLPNTAAFGFMPAYVGDYFGAKVIAAYAPNMGTEYPSHIGYVMLFESEHCTVSGLIEAGSITEIRTGCVSAVATDLLARLLAASRLQRVRRIVLALAIVLNLGLLCYVKYAGVVAGWINALAGRPWVPVPELTLPLGISFWVFRAISYAMDVARGLHPPARNPIDFLCYMALFPIFVSGPIVRWADVSDAFSSRPFSAPLAASGFRRLLVGFAKKVLLANQLALFADAVWELASDGHAMSPGMAALGVAAYTLQLYFDFSGYSDMAIGLGRLLGFNFRENFLWPYASASIREFWRRWHISLSTWFRDYLYIPLGGSRRGTARTCLNGLVVFTLCGMWHGAGLLFALWGLWHGLLLCAERLFGPRQTKGAPPPRRPPAIAALRFLAAHAYALASIAFGWILFRSATPSAAGVVLRSLAGLAPLSRESRTLWLDCTPLF